MKTRIKIVIISIIAILMLTGGLLFAIKHKKQSVQYFYDSGYVINNIYDSNSSNNVDKVYFDENTSYVSHSDNKFSFTNSSGERKTIDQENFIHYTNGSITSLKDGVVIDLNDVDSGFIKYYNVFANAIINKKPNGYQIQNLNEIVSLKNILFKISDSKYLIGAENIVISSIDNSAISMKNYAEIEYVDKNIVRIYNDEANYQTIASNLFAMVDNTLIDLEYKTISKNDKQYLTMADMVINEDDNIEILPIRPIVNDENDSNDTNNGEDLLNNNGNNNSSVNSENDEALNNAIINTPNVPENEEPTYEQPILIIESMSVTTLGFENLKMQMEDPSGVLYGNKTVQIVENSTGKVVQVFTEWGDTSLNYFIDSYYSLKTNTEYTLTVTGQYKVEDTVYDRTFASKMFRTLDIGIELTEDYVTDKAVSFAIYKNSYSNVKSFDYEITDSKGNLLKNDKATFNDSNLIKVAVTSDETTINPNSDYTLNIKNIRYGNEILSTISYEALKTSYTLKTLKETPNRNLKLTSAIDSLKNSLTLGLEGINDPNKGIKSYTYNVYNLASNELLYTSKKDSYGTLQVSIEDLGQGGDYYFNVEIEFDDNEKTIIYTTLDSEPINTSLIVYPQIVGYESISIKDLNCEELDGKIKMEDKSDFISINQISQYKIIIKEKANPNLSTQSYENEINITTYKTNSILYVPIHFSDLKPNTEYVLYTYLNFNGNYIYIGYESVKTKEPDTIYLTATNNTVSSTELFTFNVKLDESKISPSVSKMTLLKFELYGCDSNDKCYNLNYYRTIPLDQNNQEELDDLKNNNAITVTSSEFEFYPIDYNTEYTNYKVIASTYGNGYNIPIAINNATNEYALFIIDTTPTVNINVNNMPNSECEVSDTCTYNDSLDQDTIVGFKMDMSTIKSTMGYPIQNIYYDVKEYGSEGCNMTFSENNDFTKISMDNTLSKTHYLLMNNEDDYNLKRGTKYCLYYYGDYTDKKEGKTKYSELISTEIYASKQPSKISGYISNYTGTSMTLNMIDIDDPDKTIKSIYLKSNSNIVKNTTPYASEGKYTFTTLNSGEDYGLFAVENLGLMDKEHKIYDAIMDEVYTITSPKLLVSNEIAGKLIFKLPYSQDYCSDECIYNNFQYPELIAGLVLNNEYLPLTQMENYYQADLNYSSLSNYGLQIQNNLINLENIKLVYTNGAIDQVTNNKIFLKNIYALDNNKYYNGKLGGFSALSIDSIFEPQYLNDQFASFNNQNIKITNSIYSSAIENSSIGQLLNSELIQFNRANLSTLTLYDDLTQTQISSIASNETVSTSSFETKNTSTGANVKFDITSVVKENTVLKVRLNYNSTYEEATLKYKNSVWISDSNSTRMEIIPSDSEISILFKDLSSYNSDEIVNYTYDILYSFDGTTFYDTYNDDLHILNSNIEIKALRDLLIQNSKTKYEKTYWNLNSNKTDILFLKQLKSTFDVDTTTYTLNNDEIIKYDISLYKINGEPIQIANDSTLLATNSLNINLGTYSFDGIYQVNLLPKIVRGSDSITLNPISIGNVTIDSKEPVVSVENYRSTTFHISIDDSDGMLVPCEDTLDYAGITKIDITNPDNEYEGNKNMYFELNYDGTTFAYSKIPFSVKTTMVDSNDLFASNQNLVTGDYIAHLKYCVGTSTNKIDKTFSLNVYNSGLLNLKVFQFPKDYLLKMDNPDKNSVDAIKSIKYQYVLSTSPTPIIKVITDLAYIIDTDKNGNKTYFLELGIDDNLTSNVTSLTINFFDDNNQLITSYSK